MCSADHPDQFAQHGVAGSMAVRIVDALEIVDVEQDEGDRLPEPDAAVQFRCDHAVEMSAVPGPSQAIGGTAFLQLGCDPASFGDLPCQVARSFCRPSLSEPCSIFIRM